MRITKKVFHDLAIFMILLGIGIGFAFPFFCLLLGVPKDIAFSPLFIAACIIAGIILAAMNITLARITVGSRIRLLSHKMKHVEAILTSKKSEDTEVECSPENCLIIVDSTDEIGEGAESFNRMVMTLSDVLKTKNEIFQFSEMLSSHLDMDALAGATLRQLIKNTAADGGAILIERGGDLVVVASDSIKDASVLENNNRILRIMKTLERQIIKFPDEVIMDGVLVDFQPYELLIEPIIYKHIIIGVIILAGISSFSENSIERLSLLNQTISLAFNNAITHSQMQRLAALDALTGLYNRRFGSLRLQEEFSRSIRSGLPFSLLMFDIDHFKSVNDTYGHLAGDKVLVNIAKITLSVIREGDVLLRYGGEEFLCILPGANQNDANIVAERIRIRTMDSSVRYTDQEIKVTISIGISTYPHHDISSVDQLIQLADDAMYAAKTTGRNRVVSS